MSGRTQTPPRPAAGAQEPHEATRTGGTVSTPQEPASEYVPDWALGVPGNEPVWEIDLR